MKKTEKDTGDVQSAGEEECPPEEGGERPENRGGYRGSVPFRSGRSVRILKDRIFPGDVRQ